MKKRKLELVRVALLLASCSVWAMAQATTAADAIALEQQGKLAEAAKAWRAVTAGNPRDAAAFASLGVVLSRLQNYPEAASAYRRALALNPKLPGVELNLGLAEFKQGHFRRGLPQLCGPPYQPTRPIRRRAPSWA